MLNCSLTGFYDYMKESMFFRFGEHWFVEPVACLFSVSLVSCISLPFDNLRTKLMQMNVKQERNRLNATNMIDCIMLSLKIERNWAAMWAGFTTYFINMLLFT